MPAPVVAQAHERSHRVAVPVDQQRGHVSIGVPRDALLARYAGELGERVLPRQFTVRDVQQLALRTVGAMEQDQDVVLGRGIGDVGHEGVSRDLDDSAEPRDRRRRLHLLQPLAPVLLQEPIVREGVLVLHRLERVRSSGGVDVGHAPRAPVALDRRPQPSILLGGVRARDELLGQRGLVAEATLDVVPYGGLAFGAAVHHVAQVFPHIDLLTGAACPRSDECFTPTPKRSFTASACQICGQISRREPTLNHGMPLIETRGFTSVRTSSWLRPESRPGGSQTREAPAPGSRDC